MDQALTAEGSRAHTGPYRTPTHLSPHRFLKSRRGGPGGERAN
jgi:hypothetical protein